MNFEFYDNAGYLYTARFSIHATSTNGRYYIALDDIRDSTGASVGADVLGRTNFGSTMEVETSINYTPLNGTSAASLAGDIEFTDATGATLGNQAINTGITVDAAMDDFLEKVYGIKGNSTATPPIGKIKIDAEGGLSVLEPADAKTTFYAPIAGVDSEVTNKVLTVSHADGTSVQLTPGGPYVPDDGAPAPSIADLAKYYGLNVTDEKVKEIMVNDNGSITVTKKDVDKAAYLEFDPGTGKFVSVGGSGEGLITLGLSGANGTSFKDINLNFSTCSNVNNNGSSTISSAKGDSDGLGSGRAMGEMISLSVAQDGIITAAYDNGMSRCLGQIATAAFANPSGLEKVGDNLYQATRNSGDFDGIGTDITDGGGKMQSGVLEMSNVDLSQEFTEMITTQRGFQANSRIITVSDTMLEELTNLKR